MTTKWSVCVASLSVLVSLEVGMTGFAQENEFPLWPFDESRIDSSEQEDSSEEPTWMLGSRLARYIRPQAASAPSPHFDERGYVLGQNHPSALQYVANTPRRMAGRVRSLWNRSLDLLKFGDEGTRSSSRRSRPRRPILGRLFGGDDDVPEGPQTITEWMEQDRLEP